MMLFFGFKFGYTSPISTVHFTTFNLDHEIVTNDTCEAIGQELMEKYLELLDTGERIVARFYS